MTAQDQVHACLRPTFNRMFAAVQQVPDIIGTRRHKRLMRNDNPQLPRCRMFEPADHAFHLLLRYFAILMTMCPRSIHTDYQQLSRFEHGFEIVPEHAPEIGIRVRNAREEVVQRNVMIARHDNKRRRTE